MIYHIRSIDAEFLKKNVDSINNSGDNDYENKMKRAVALGFCAIIGQLHRERIVNMKMGLRRIIVVRHKAIGGLGGRAAL